MASPIAARSRPPCVERPERRSNGAVNASGWFRRDAAQAAGRRETSGGSSLARFAILTVLLALLAVVVALPRHGDRELRMVRAARAELFSLIAAVDQFRALNYRLPDTLEELDAIGYSRSPVVTICTFRHVPDQRHFEDHVEIVLRHRASARALVARYPAADSRFREIDADIACNRDAAPAAAMEGRYP